MQPSWGVTKWNRGPIRTGFRGHGLVFGEKGAEEQGAGFHLSLPGLLLPPAAASQPRAFPPPPDHIGLRCAEPQSPPKECASLGMNPGAALLVYVSVSLSASSAAVRGTPLLPAPFPLTRERIPAGGGGAEEGNDCLREAVTDPRATPHQAPGSLADQPPSPPHPAAPFLHPFCRPRQEHRWPSELGG